jgi:hypothetical protein
VTDEDGWTLSMCSSNSDGRGAIRYVEISGYHIHKRISVASLSRAKVGYRLMQSSTTDTSNCEPEEVALRVDMLLELIVSSIPALWELAY